MKFFISLIFGSSLFYLLSPSLLSQELSLSCKSAILIDYYSGRVLYSKKANISLSPASLTKIVTMDLVFEQIAKGNFELSSIVPISKNAWRPNLPKGSSLMFIAPGHRVSVHELLLGVAVASGNDAAVALAEYVSGSQYSFVRAMNDKMQRLGFSRLSFKDSSGLNPNSRVTAAEFAQFAKIYLHSNQMALVHYHSIWEMTYPHKTNMTRKKASPIRQENRNSLLKSYFGLDGLKTGYIRNVGYNIVLTANRSDTRLIAIVLGSPGVSHEHGSLNRNRDGKALLDYGFKFFKTITITPSVLKSERVWFGNKNRVQGYINEEAKVTLARHRAQYLRPEVEYRYLKAPIKKDEVIGHLVYFIGLKPLAKLPILAKEDVEEGSFFKRILDMGKKWFRENGDT